MNPWGYLFIALGLFGASGSIFDWNWYMNSRKARFVCSLFGRLGARIFYTFVSLGVFAYGLMVLKGIVEFNAG